MTYCTLEHIAAKLGVPVAAFLGGTRLEKLDMGSETASVASGPSKAEKLPISSLRSFKTRFGNADPNLRGFMIAQVRALFGPDARKILAWLNTR
jgi:hypothetical protein